LSEVWFEKKFASNGASIKIGQLAADTEFFLRRPQPNVSSKRLAHYRGGQSAEWRRGISLVDPRGSPQGRSSAGPGDEQVRNKYGLNFRVNDPPCMIGEARFRINAGKNDERLATTLTLGGWGHVGKFDDKRFAIHGSLLANPAGPGLAL
jgi:porin